MIAFNDFFTALKTGARKFRLLVLASLMLMPVLIAAPFTSVQKDASTHLDRIHASVVNLDTPITLNGQLTPLGRLLVANLVGQKDKRNITWTQNTPETARKGLADGTFSVVLWIPPTFSKDATSWSDIKHPDKAVRALLNVQTSPSSGVADPVIGAIIAQAAVEAINSFLTGQFLTNVFLGFNRAYNQLTTAVDAANKLSDGANQLNGGLGLASNGADRLSAGLHQISDGANQIDAGTGLLANGSDQLAWGMGLLSDGLNLMANKTDGVPQNLAALAQGSRLLADGLAAGAKRSNQYFDTYLPELNTIQGTYAANSQEIESTLNTAAAAVDTIDSLRQQCVGNPLPICSTVQTLVTQYTGIDANNLKLLSTYLRESGPAIGNGLKDLRALHEGLNTAAAASKKIADANLQVAIGIAQLKSGIDQAADGGNRLKVGADQLSAGAHQLHDGAHLLAAGAKLASDGSDQLAAGLKVLKAGSALLADGNKQLADGLANGLKDIPTFNPDQIAKLSDLLANPVASNLDIYSIGAGLGTAYFSALALAIAALVLFMILRATPIRSLTSSNNSLVLALQAFRPAAIICVVQAALLTPVIGAMLHVTFYQSVRFLIVSIFAALSFASVSQGLVALFGGRGRFLGLAVLTLCAPALVISTVPSILKFFMHITPIGPAADAMRAVLAYTSGLIPALLVLTIWYFIGLAMTVVAISRQRGVNPTRFIKTAAVATA